MKVRLYIFVQGLLLLSGGFLFGYFHGKHVADKWYLENSRLSLALAAGTTSAPIIAKNWQPDDAFICLNPDGTYKPAKNTGWIFCGISIDSRARVLYGNGATCSEVKKRLDAYYQSGAQP